MRYDYKRIISELIFFDVDSASRITELLNLIHKDGIYNDRLQPVEYNTEGYLEYLRKKVYKYYQTHNLWKAILYYLYYCFNFDEIFYTCNICDIYRIFRSYIIYLSIIYLLGVLESSTTY